MSVLPPSLVIRQQQARGRSRDRRVALGKSAGDLVLTAEAPLTARAFAK